MSLVQGVEVLVALLGVAGLPFLLGVLLADPAVLAPWF
jgi:hypothetical protein